MMRDWEDYYQILGVGPDSSLKEVRAARNRKAFAYHPDRHRQAPESDRHAAQEEMKRVNRAYEVLSTAHLREQFHSEWVQRNRKGTQEIKTGIERNAEPTPNTGGTVAKPTNSYNPRNEAAPTAGEPKERMVEWFLKGVRFGAVAGAILGAFIGTLAGLDMAEGTIWVIVLSIGGALAGFLLGVIGGGTYGAMLGEYVDRMGARSTGKPRGHGP